MARVCIVDSLVILSRDIVTDITDNDMGYYNSALTERLENVIAIIEEINNDKKSTISTDLIIEIADIVIKIVNNIKMITIINRDDDAKKYLTGDDLIKFNSLHEKLQFRKILNELCNEIEEKFNTYTYKGLHVFISYEFKRKIYNSFDKYKHLYTENNDRPYTSIDLNESTKSRNILLNMIINNSEELKELVE